MMMPAAVYGVNHRIRQISTERSLRLLFHYGLLLFTRLLHFSYLITSSSYKITMISTNYSYGSDD